MKLDEALTFDDVLIRPGYSSILPRDVNTQTYFSRDIKINILEKFSIYHFQKIQIRYMIMMII